MDSRRTERWIACLLAAVVVSCGGEEAGGGAPEPLLVEVSPTRAEVPPGSSLQFSAVVRGDDDPRVAWSVVEGSRGGEITADGRYTAPAIAGTYHVSAVVDAPGHPSGPGASAMALAVVAVTAARGVSVSVVPSSAEVEPGVQVRLEAVIAGTTDARATWSVQEGAAGGKVDAAGVYTAPLTRGTYHVVAASAADATARATATITVVPRVLAVTPATASVQVGSRVQFTAALGASLVEVTWSVAEGASGGSVGATGLFTAPLAPGTYHVVATHAGSGATASAAVTVTDAGPNLIDHGGPVLPRAHVYAIWWGDQAFLANSVAAFEAFLADLDGSSYLALLDQYLRGEKARVVRSRHFFEPDIPVEAFNADIPVKACDVITAAGEGVDPVGIYFVFTSFPLIHPGAAGWHGYDMCNGSLYRLVWVSPSPDFLDPCQGRPGPAAAAVGIASHELIETITDGGPGTAWLDAANAEIADKCWYYCHRVGASSWWTAGAWSNETQSCEPQPLPN